MQDTHRFPHLFFAALIVGSMLSASVIVHAEEGSADAVGRILTRHESSIAKWENDIRRFEALDKSETYDKDAVLFVGSSSIRLWSTLAEDMSPYPVIRRGYGGAKLCDTAYYARRIIHPHAFRAMVLFVGNDVRGTDDDKTPEEVVLLFRDVVGKAREKNPDAPIVLIEITPTASRWSAWPEIHEANEELRKACASIEDVHFLATSSPGPAHTLTPEF